MADEQQQGATMEFGMLVRPSPLIAGVFPSGAPSEPKIVLRMETVVGSLLIPITTEQAQALGQALQRVAREVELTPAGPVLTPDDLATLKRIAEQAEGGNVTAMPTLPQPPKPRKRAPKKETPR